MKLIKQMEEIKENQIKSIMKLLNDGLTIIVKDAKDNSSGKLWEIKRSYGTYICWQHYGQSANKRTLKELKWILNTIFNCRYKKVIYSIEE